MNFIQTFGTNITTLQEIWQKGDMIQSKFKNSIIQERTNQKGGGTATIMNNFPAYTIKKKIRINKDTNLLRINFCNNYIWLANVYLYKGSISKLQKLFGIIQKHIPSNEVSQLLLIGDFNIDLNNKKSDIQTALEKLCKYIGVRPEKPGAGTRQGAILDYIICGKNISVEEANIVRNNASDHSAIKWKLSIKFPTRLKQVKIPSRKTAEEIIRKILANEEVINSAAFLDQLYLYRKDNHSKIKQIVHHRQRDTQLFEKLLALDDPAQVKDTINNHWSDKWTDTESKRWSQDSKIAYNDLKKILKYHLYEKRDGGIINQVLSDDGSTIITSPAEVNEQLAKTIEVL